MARGILRLRLARRLVRNLVTRQEAITDQQATPAPRRSTNAAPPVVTSTTEFRPLVMRDPNLVVLTPDKQQTT
jgi:hypothetical protein